MGEKRAPSQIWLEKCLDLGFWKCYIIDRAIQAAKALPGRLVF
jgi:hypothetical protein